MIVKANASLAAQGNTTIKTEQAFALTVQEVDMLEVLVLTHLVIALFVNLGATHRTMGNRAAKYVRKVHLYPTMVEKYKNTMLKMIVVLAMKVPIQTTQVRLRANCAPKEPIWTM